MKSGRLALPQKVILFFYFIKILSEKKLKKNGLCSKGLKLLYLNYEVAGVTEAAARVLDDRIRGPTLVVILHLPFLVGKLSHSYLFGLA